MKKLKTAVAAALLAGLVLVKILVPEIPAAMREKARDILTQEADSVTVFERLREHIFSAGTPKQSAEASAPETVLPVQVEPTAAPFYVSLYIEEAKAVGEVEPEATDEVPEAVAAFLESQKAFSDYALPENVDYSYVELPFDFTVPVSGYQSSGFGYRLHPIQNVVKFHYGTDIAAWSGAQVLAFVDGTVTFAGYSDSYGYYVKIDHGNGWQSLYAHCSKLYVQYGQSVEMGECIALVGATGLATGPHLHFELTCDGKYLNPEYYINSV